MYILYIHTYIYTVCTYMYMYVYVLIMRSSYIKQSKGILVHVHDERGLDIFSEKPAATQD